MALTGPDEAIRDADLIEARAYADLFEAAPAALRSRFAPKVHRIGTITALSAPGLPSSLFNRAIGLGVGQAADPAQVETLVRTFHDEGVRDWWLHCSPIARPHDLEQMLRARGFVDAPRRRWAKMHREPIAPAPVATSLQVRRVVERHEAHAAAAAIARGFEMPPFMADWLVALHGRPGWHLHAAFDGAQAVGAGYLYIEGDLAWLGIAAVLPSHRRRGGQRALMAQRIGEAIDSGCRAIVTETGEADSGEPNPSLQNMLRSGFRRVASRLNLLAPSS